MCFLLRDEEKFVMDSLRVAFGGTWVSGEDPPDAYLDLGDVKIAVEITTLVQQIKGKSGNPVSRLTIDLSMLRILEELDKEIGELVPSGFYLIVTFYAPVNKPKEFKEELKAKLSAILKTGISEETFEIYTKKDNVKIHSIRGQRESGKKITGGVVNKCSNPNILFNAEFLLAQKIQEKTIKCSMITHRPLWLALLNWHWLAEPNSYRIAMKNYLEPHPFDKILLISGNQEVTTILGLLKPMV